MELELELELELEQELGLPNCWQAAGNLLDYHESWQKLRDNVGLQLNQWDRLNWRDRLNMRSRLS